MASSSSSNSFPPPPPDPSSSQSCDYDVFLSFRGIDTRKTFVDHLYAMLTERGIRAFKDNERLEAGESISPQLLNAIEQSRSAIVVFSENYASSSWCLDELVKIMKRKDQKRLVVLPVFYDVHPNEVRRQLGTFGEGFRKGAERNVDKAEVWRKALHDAADLSGYDLRNTADGLESQCIKTVVDWCSSHSYNISAAIDEDLIGMPARVSNLIKLLQLGRESDEDDVRMIGIWGMGGAGKTTLAEVTFEEVKEQFDGASFIADVREKSKGNDGLQHLQEEILSDILIGEKVKVHSVLKGKKMMKQRLGHKKVLIILDDVDDGKQLGALAGDHLELFGKGSRVLVTTRNRHLLDAHGVDENDIHSVKLLTGDEAFVLFSCHAFKKRSPTKEYNELSLRVVSYAAGLPLALRVLGSLLCGRGLTAWTDALKRLEKIPEGEILEILQISYDGLKQVEKQIFLDIACFFHGRDKDEVIRTLDSCEFYPDIGIDVLVKKGLISVLQRESIDGDLITIIQMHDLLQEMGKNIGRHSRLWDIEDIKDTLQNNTGTEAIEAIVCNWLPRDEYTSLFGQLGSCDPKALMSMKKLRLLHLSTSYSYWERDEIPVVGGPGYDLPNKLQCLSWRFYAGKSLPESFQAPKLVILEMPFSNINVQLWEGKKRLNKLKFLNLRFSEKLIRTPDFSDIPNLTELNLHYCISLIEVHPSLGHLQKLVKLDLSSCFDLVDFPPEIHVKFLEILNFSECRKLTRFPELLGNNDILSELHLKRTAIESLPSSIANLTKLVSIDLTGCRNLFDLPDTICTLKNLKKMKLGGCTKLRKLPENLGHIESLEELNVGSTGVKVLPSSIGHLKKLRHVSLSGYSKLILEDSMTHIGSCLKVLDLSHCASLSDHQATPIDVGHLSFLETLDLRFNPIASSPFIISQLPRLKSLDLSWCRNLKALPELPSSIAILEADYCTSLESIESLSAGKYEWLWKVSLRGCKKLTMHEKCEQLNDCHKQEKSTMDHLLQSMLLREHVVVNHRFDICYTEKSFDRAIPKWFGQQVMIKGNRFVLKLTPNWPSKIAGFAMCAISDRGHVPEILDISLYEVGWQIPGLHAKLARSSNYVYNDVWIGYISLKMLQHSIERKSMTSWNDWMNTATQILLTFSKVDSDRHHIESCAARVVCMDEVEHLDATPVSSSFTSNNSSRDLQQHYDPNFADDTALRCSETTETAIGITLRLRDFIH